MTRERFMEIFLAETMDVVRAVLADWGIPASPVFLLAVEDLYREASARVTDELLSDSASMDERVLRALLRANGEPDIRETLEGLRPARVRALALSSPSFRARVLH